MKRRLVLLADRFPLASGDGVFLGNEIAALAAEFDDVVVFNFTDASGSTLTLPAGVRYGGNLFGRSPVAKLRTAANPLRWPEMARAFSAGIGLRAALREVVAAIAAICIAEDPRLRSAVNETGWTSTVYAYWGMRSGLATPFIRGAARRVVRLHRYDLYGELPLRSILYGRVDRILTVSDEGKRYLRRYGDDVIAKTVVARLGTADHGVTPARIDGAPVRVVSCSGIRPVKRVPLIAEAMLLLPGLLGREVIWCHFGDGPDREQLASVVRAAPSALTAELVGEVSNADVLRWYGSEHVDVFVNASESEGVPVSIMEAMSYDIPIVATDAGGTSELLTGTGGVGILVPVDVTAPQLAESLARAVSDRDSFSPRAQWSRRANASVTARRAAELVSGRTS